MIKITNLYKTYNRNKSNECKALVDVSLEIERGEFIAIMGKSGSGKSTLLHILGCIDSHEKGQYLLNSNLTSKLSERQLAKLRCKEIGIIKQDFALIEDYTVLQNVMIPLYFSKAKSKLKAAKTALDSVGISELINKQVKKLSGGQKQRVAIARALVNNPNVILADEPTGALDSVTANEIMEIIKKLNNNGATVIIVTHDLNIAEQADRIIKLSDGQVIEDSNN
jgi:putative ABC transport system ATP-binding protein